MNQIVAGATTASRRQVRKKEGRSLPAVVRWPLFGALFAAGAVGVSRWLGPPVVRDLGGEAGRGFAEAVAKFNEARRGVARGASVGRWSGR